MKVRYGKDRANHSGPESCGGYREVTVEALTGETGRPAIEPRNQQSGMPTLLSEAEGNTAHDVYRQSSADPARSKTLRMPGSFLHRSWEVSSVPDKAWSGGARKAPSQNLAIDADEKSDTLVVPRKPPNKGAIPAEAMEGRGVAKGNTDQAPASRTQSRKGCA